MRNISSTFLKPAIISSILVLPFVILELINRRSLREDFPYVLFGMLWILAGVFTLLLMPIVQNVQAGNRIRINLINLLRVVSLVLIASLWVGIVLDQMPCFLGIPNCD
jgi:hypothetical protein